jgi:hypothetical protein
MLITIEAEVNMNPDVFNMQVRKYLKQVGVTSQREIEDAVRKALEASAIQDNEKIRVRTTLEIEQIGLTHIVEDSIDLE